jgi:sugar/nucleoside kinase (ribokinase family)
MIVCLGDLMLDILIRRREGEGIEGVVERLSVQPGGSAANAAAWLAYQGVPAGFIGAAGTDLVGDLLVEDLQRRGVRCAVSRLPHQQSGVLLIEALPDGRTLPAGRRGANNEIVPATEAQREMLRGAGWLHITAYALYAEVSRAPVLEAAALARSAGARISLDLGSPHLVQHIGMTVYIDLIRAIAPDVLLANHIEAALLPGGEADPLAALGALAPTAVLKRAAAGCIAVHAGRRYEQPALPAAETDPMGAGDAFAAGLIAALIAEKPIAEALLAAARLGAQCVALDGGRPPLQPGE